MTNWGLFSQSRGGRYVFADVFRCTFMACSSNTSHIQRKSPSQRCRKSTRDYNLKLAAPSRRARHAPSRSPNAHSHHLYPPPASALPSLHNLFPDHQGHPPRHSQPPSIWQAEPPSPLNQMGANVYWAHRCARLGPPNRVSFVVLVGFWPSLCRCALCSLCVSLGLCFGLKQKKKKTHSYDPNVRTEVF